MLPFCNINSHAGHDGKLLSPTRQKGILVSKNGLCLDYSGFSAAFVAGKRFSILNLIVLAHFSLN